MPTRPRSHQLEDISLAAFRALLPVAWVVRDKPKDYGVDLEVELFEGNGASTGFVFLVQVRGTDNRAKADRLTLKVDQIKYFSSLDLPVLVARYCDAAAIWHVEWSFNMGCGIPEQQKSFTHRFDATNQWTTGHPLRIRRSLEVLKALSTAPVRTRIGLRVDGSALRVSQRYAFEAAIDDLVERASDTLFITTDPDQIVALDISGENLVLKIELDCVASATVHLAGWDRQDLLRRLVFAIILVCRVRDLNRIAASLAALAVAEKLEPLSRRIAFQAATALAPNLTAAVEMAILGKLPEDHDHVYVGFIAFLLRTPATASDRLEAVTAFYAAAIEYAGKASELREASIRYSLGNFLRVDGKFSQALFQFNRARHLRPLYAETGYFLREVGSCLYNRGRFQWAYRLYQRAIDLDGSSQVEQLYLGDAALMAGLVAIARDAFKAASEGSDRLAMQIAMIKQGLALWLIELTDSTEIPRRQRDAAEADRSDAAALENIVRHIDALDGHAHYNLGVIHAKATNWPSAISHFLAAAFRCNSDHDAWANALISAWNIGNPNLIISLMSTALSLAGRTAYDRLRELLTAQDAHDGMIEALDEIVRSLTLDIRASESRSVTLRAIGERHFDVAVLSPSSSGSSTR